MRLLPALKFLALAILCTPLVPFMGLIGAYNILRGRGTATFGPGFSYTYTANH